MSSVLITGVNGFIGSHVARRFQKDGHQVRGLVRKTSDLSFLKGLDVQLHVGDITLRETLRKPLSGVDVVVHNAGLASDWGPYRKFYEINVEGTRNVAEIAAGQGVKRFVQISSAVLHGFGNPGKMDETSPLADSIFPYCRTKKIAEEWLFASVKETTMEVVAIRPGNVFGPRDHTFMEKYLDALVKGRVGYVGGGRSPTCPIYVENLAEAICLAAFAPAARGEAFLVTEDLDLDWRTFTEKFADELGLGRPTLSVPFWLGYSLAYLLEGFYRIFSLQGEPLLTRYRICNAGKAYHFSVEKAKRLLKYAPVVPFEEAVRRTVTWYVGRGAKLTSRRGPEAPPPRPPLQQRRQQENRSQQTADLPGGRGDAEADDGPVG